MTDRQTIISPYPGGLGQRWEDHDTVQATPGGDRRHDTHSGQQRGVRAVQEPQIRGDASHALLHLLRALVPCSWFMINDNTASMRERPGWGLLNSPGPCGNASWDLGGQANFMRPWHAGHVLSRSFTHAVIVVVGSTDQSPSLHRQGAPRGPHTTGQRMQSSWSSTAQTEPGHPLPRHALLGICLGQITACSL